MAQQGQFLDAVHGDAPSPISSGSLPKGNPFIGIQFKCCRTYGRIYRNRDRNAYVGNCPKCAARIKVPIGPGGGSNRFFSAG